MTTDADPAPARDSEVSLQRVVHAERPALELMIDAYLPELAAHRERPVGPIDAASYVYLPLYWEEPGRHPYFIVAGGERVGFVLVRVVEHDAVIEMSDFFVLPACRRGGIGRAALARLWRRFPGAWRLQVHPHNAAAAAFWPGCIEAHTAGEVRVEELTHEDGRRLEYSFEIVFA